MQICQRMLGKPHVASLTLEIMSNKPSIDTMMRFSVLMYIYLFKIYNIRNFIDRFVTNYIYIYIYIYMYILRISKGVKNVICRSVGKSKYLAGNETFYCSKTFWRELVMSTFVISLLIFCRLALSIIIEIITMKFTLNGTYN